MTVEKLLRRHVFKSQVTEITVASGQTGSPIRIDQHPFTVTVHPAGSGKIQYTTSLPSLVEAGTARWIDWARGSVSQPTSDIPEGPVVAIRGVSVSGDLVVEVVQ